MIRKNKQKEENCIQEMDVKILFGDVDISNAKNIDELLININEKENQIDNELDRLLQKQCQVEAKMRGIHKAFTGMADVLRDCRKLDQQISYTAELAESVSAKVRRLDLARSRVSDCQQRIHDLIDLQLCAQGVKAAITGEEYEVGAGHISRFLSMDLQLLKRTADDVQGSMSTVSEAVKTLEEATWEMRDLIVKRVDEAIKRDDLASIERFFKIFPLLNCHKEGIDKFSAYICTKLAIKGQKEMRNTLDIAKAEKRLPVAYADTLTTLLEHFARVVEVNQPILEACYGFGYLLDMLMPLQRQCDAVVKMLLLEFKKNRKINQHIQNINELSRNNLSGASLTLGHYRKSSATGSSDKLNPKDLDSIITEITIMHSRVELYFRFIKRRVTNDIAGTSQTATDKIELDKKLHVLNQLITHCDLNRLMQELLDTYLLLERYFMEESVLKAIAVDCYEDGQQCSSMVDDVFYIIRKTIRRALSSQSVNGTCAVINNAAACLDNDFINVLRTDLKSGYPSGYIDLAQAYNAIQITIQQGKLQANDNEKARSNFLIRLNNADISTEYTEILWQTMEQEILGAFPTLTTLQRQLIDSCLAELKSVGDTLKTCVDFAMQQLRSSVIKPRLHPWIDQYLNYKHHLTEEDLVAYEAGETFVQFLIVQLDSLLNTFKQAMTPRNYDAFVSILVAELTTRFERAIKKCTFNRLGGLILDQEVRALGAYLANATSWSVRDKMTRLTQIATLLNLENVSEFNDYWDPANSNESSSSWRITSNEVRILLALRADFKLEDIKRLRF